MPKLKWKEGDLNTSNAVLGPITLSVGWGRDDNDVAGHMAGASMTLLRRNALATREEAQYSIEQRLLATCIRVLSLLEEDDE